MTDVTNADTGETTVWANEWNPPVDMYDPNADVLTVPDFFGQSHGDVATAPTMSEQPNDPDAGTTADVRANLLTDVRNRMTTPPPLTQEHHHVVETVELGSDAVRARVVRVAGNVTETELLAQDDRRARALIKVVTSTSVIVIGPSRQGGNPAFNAVPTGPSAYWYHATGDGTLEVKATAAVSAYGTSATGAVDVAIWEELSTPGNEPGLAV